MEYKRRRIKPSLVFTTNSRLFKSLSSIKLFIADSVTRDIPLWRNIDSVKSSYFNKINFTQSMDVADYISLHITDNLKAILCDIIKLSSFTNSTNLAASNAISILNRANFIFKNLNFSKIKVPGANLSGSTFINTNFEGSDLTGVNFSDSKLYSCKFNNCNLTRARFSNLTDLYKQKSHPINISIAKDEKLLLTCNDDKKIRFRTLSKNTKLPEIGDLKHNIDWAEFSPCKDYIAILSKEKGLKLWDIKLNKIIAGWNYVYGIKYCTFSSCGRYIACNGDKFIQIFDLIDQSKCKRIKTVSDWGVRFNKSGKILIYWSGKRMWEIVLNKEKITENEILRLNTDWTIQIVDFSSNDKYLAMNGWSKHSESIISVLNFHTKEFSFRLNCKEIGWVYSLSWSPNKNLLVSGHFKGTVCLWDIDNQTELALIRNFCRITANANFSPSGKYITFAEDKGIIKLWNIKKQEAQKNIDKDEGKIIAISFSSCEKFIYQISEYYSIDRFDIKNKKWENILKEHKEVNSATFSECGKYCAVGSQVKFQNYEINIWDLECKKLYGKLNSSSSALMLKFSFCGNFLISGHSDFGIIWDLETRDQIYNIKSRTYNAAWSPNGEYFATSCWNISIWKFDKENPSVICILDQFPQALRFSKCNSFLYSEIRNGSVTIWDFLENQKIKILESLDENGNLLVNCPGLGLLAVGGDKNIIIVWNIETWEKVIQFNTNQGQLNALSITRSGKYIVSGSIHKYAHCWKLY